MFEVISDLLAHWYTFVIPNNFCYAKKMICALMFIISNQFVIKCLSNLLQFDPCNVMFNVFSVIMAHWYDCKIHLLLQLIPSMQRK